MAPAAPPLDVLTRGAITLRGRLPCSSNATFLVEAALEGVTALAVYKPLRGERPLWDFPPGLFRREIAAYRLSEALGWGLVPLTVERDDGPIGPGSLQRFVPAHFEQHYFTLLEKPQHRERLQRICLLDIVANNADRKGGHCLLGEDGIVYAIDNGLTFHVELKLRTVIWDFAGEPIPRQMLVDLGRVLGARARASLADLLEPTEQEAVLARARGLVKAGRFPRDPSGARYPWPLV